MANSLTDLVKSVDWSKVMSGADARNALIGSALGGAVLGGMGLMQDRDPEESKFAPVGDALLGTVLGGVAGYGIPKAFALIRDSGALAPDNDQLKSNYLGYGLGGAAAGAGAFGVSLNKTLDRARVQLGRMARKNFDAKQTMAQTREAMARLHGKSKAVIDSLADEASMWSRTPADAEAALAVHRRGIVKALREGRWSDAKAGWERFKELSDLRKRAIRGYSGGLAGIRELLGQASKQPINTTNRPMGLLRSLLTGRFRGPGSFATHGAHYVAKAPWWTLGLKTVGSGPRALARGGKYALGGAALGMLLHKMLGPSATNNYKK